MWRKSKRQPKTHHGPHGTLTSPVDNLVHRTEGILYAVAGRLEAELVRASLGERERVVGLGLGDARVDESRCPLLGGRGGHGSRGASGRGGDGAGEGQGTSLTQRRRESCWAGSTSQLPVMDCEKLSMHLSELTAWLPCGSRGVDTKSEADDEPVVANPRDGFVAIGASTSPRCNTSGLPFDPIQTCRSLLQVYTAGPRTAPRLYGCAVASSSR